MRQCVSSSVPHAPLNILHISRPFTSLPPCPCVLRERAIFVYSIPWCVGQLISTLFFAISPIHLIFWIVWITKIKRCYFYPSCAAAAPSNVWLWIWLISHLEGIEPTVMCPTPYLNSKDESIAQSLKYHVNQQTKWWRKWSCRKLEPKINRMHRCVWCSICVRLSVSGSLCCCDFVCVCVCVCWGLSHVVQNVSIESRFLVCVSISLP